ncbi:MAG TPA: class I SAM-dependent methyltransferase [Burkholderiaceae bacterium]
MRSTSLLMDNDGNPLLDYFIRNGEWGIHKVIDYFEVYHRVFQRYRGKPITFVEIGIQTGGSARMWQQYFGPQAKIIGIDIDPACKSLADEGFEVWIGDQADPAFWQEFLQVHPQIDIVLDDGGHTMAQQIVSFEALFSAVSNGGLYLCEDTCTSYWPAYGGGLKRPGTFIEYAKELIDQMHAWHYAPVSELDIPDILARHLYAVAIYDCIVVLEKRIKNPPVTLARGGLGHVSNPHSLTLLAMRRDAGVPDE